MGRQQKSTQQQRQHELDMQWNSQNFERQMFEKEMQFQREQYDYEFEKEAEYNDPSAQMERLIAAGLNPYMMLDGGNAGHVDASASSGASASAPSYQLTDQNKVAQMLGAAGNLIGGVGSVATDAAEVAMGFKSLKNDTNLKSAQVGLMQTDMQGKEIDNMYKHQSYLLDLRGKYLDNIKKGVDTEKSKSELANLDRQLYELQETWNDRSKSFGLANQKTQSEINLNDSQAALNTTLEKVHSLEIPFISRKQDAIIKRELATANYYDAMAQTATELRPHQVSKLMFDVAEYSYNGMIKGYDKAGVTLSDDEKSKRKQLYLDYAQAVVDNLESQSSNAAGAAGYIKSAINGFSLITSAVIGSNLLGKIFAPKMLVPPTLEPAYTLFGSGGSVPKRDLKPY